jgi:single-strand DNA-binding protein
MAEQSRSASGYLLGVLVGNLGRDPEMRYTPAGKAVTNFNIAVNLRTYIEGQVQVGTMWVRVTTWGGLAETCNAHLRKGNRVLVEFNSMEFDPQTGGPKIFSRSDGTAGTSYEVTANSVRFLSGPREGQQQQQGEPEEEVNIF